MKCSACHTVWGVDLDAPPPAGDINVELGGKVQKVRTYGELVTSIINPSHDLIEGVPRDEVATGGISKMADYNQVMTVAQLIDLVAFLQGRYQLSIEEWDMYYP